MTETPDRPPLDAVLKLAKKRHASQAKRAEARGIAAPRLEDVTSTFHESWADCFMCFYCQAPLVTTSTRDAGPPTRTASLDHTYLIELYRAKLANKLDREDAAAGGAS